MNEAPRRRRRVRHTPEPDFEAVALTADVVEDAPELVADSSAAEPSPAERGLRGLVGGGSSQVSPSAALRARDAARPRPEDLARAEQDLMIVRRHWAPRD